ncbi:MAG: acyl-CoA dehydrogenase family protein [Deltaproteobacteria bacterium]|nr:acyl-CoA dehydrogenase family protein [Deltaproteobacteria bacterium]
MIDLTPEQHEIQQWAREFARRHIVPRALALDQQPESPLREELLRAAAQNGLLGASLPEFLGGMGHDPLTSALVTEEIAAACSGCAVLFGATMLGLTPILLSGDIDAIMRFVPPLVASWATDQPQLAALAATEPDAGSDFINGNPAGRIRTRVEKKAGGYLINGRKVFISNGSIASLITVFASHDPSRPLREHMSCFAVPAGTPGFSVGQIFHKMGQRAAPAAELVFDDVWVPENHRIGAEGGGWALNRLIMSVTRTPVAAIALGIARSAYEKALDYAETRVQGGKPIVEHQAMQLMLADMAIRVEAARGLVQRAAQSIAGGQPSLKLSSMAKTFAADAAVANATDAIQVLGGYGYMHEYGVEKLLRDAKLTQIYEGTNQINRFEIMEAVAAQRRA